LGVGSDSHVAIYDRADGIWAARLWWQFRALGHEHVGVLDGGLAAWTADGGLLERHESSSPRPDARFEPREIDGYWADRALVRAIMEGRHAGTLVCALRPLVFAGSEVNYARPGHIPTSINLPHGALKDADGRYRRGQALREALSPLLRAPGPIVAYCGGGVTACGLALALAVAGRADVAVYDGSLSEWAADPSLPLVSLALD
jgi:thiosulfate/3-mercaptopyruvate sulfurtransferase